MSESADLFRLFHSILRWLILFSVGTAGFVALIGYLRRTPIIVWERSLTIIAMVLCHVQVVFGLILYAIRYKSYAEHTLRGFQTPLSQTVRTYWKFEHIGMMIIAIALVTVGRIVSKKAKTEPGKQLRIAIFYLIAWLMMVLMTPWPFREGIGRAWL